MKITHERIKALRPEVIGLFVPALSKKRADVLLAVVKDQESLHDIAFRIDVTGTRARTVLMEALAEIALLMLEDMESLKEQAP